MNQTVLEQDEVNIEVLDAVEEMRLRTWARTNYVPSSNREASWHPVIHEEMDRKERGL